MSESQHFITPVGRYVSGSLFKANDKDAQGNPLLVKSGPNIGQPRVNYSFGLAIEKTSPEWGGFLALVNAKAKECFPSLFSPEGVCLKPDFSFKIKDGDDQVPNDQDVKNCDRTGWAGHWVVFFSGGFPPNCFTQGGAAVINNDEQLKKGYYIRVSGSVNGNGSTQNKQGVYMNYNMIELIAYGEIIATGPDAKKTFAAPAAYVPAGASTTPTTTAPPPALTSRTGGSETVPPAAGEVAPAPDFLDAPQPVVKTMTAKADGIKYEAFIAKGWTDEKMIQAGYLQDDSDMPF